MPNLASDSSGRDESETAAAVVEDFLGQLQVGQTMRHGLLALIPLFPADTWAAKKTSYLPLADALQQGLLTITERPQATVPELEAASTAPIPVLLLNGEQVVGGLQNRVLNATILLAANAVSHVPVTCVEQGRWSPAYATSSDQQIERHSSGLRRSMGDQATTTFVAENSAYAELRKMHTKSVSGALASGAGYQSDQSMVWGAVAKRMTTTGSQSPTHAMQELYNAPVRAEELSRVVAALPKPDGALGFIVTIRDRVIGAEIFADEALALAYWEKLARSYAIEALDAPQMGETSTSVDETVLPHFLEQARSSTLRCYQSTGLGQDVRITGTEVTGAGLVYNDSMIHLTLFAEDQPAESKLAGS
jgi:hypothetical protein